MLHGSGSPLPDSCNDSGVLCSKGITDAGNVLEHWLCMAQYEDSADVKIIKWAAIFSIPGTYVEGFYTVSTGNREYW
jgi:hypothetical protein